MTSNYLTTMLLLSYYYLTDASLLSYYYLTDTSLRELTLVSDLLLASDLLLEKGARSCERPLTKASDLFKRNSQ